jgi:hypothetical protein
LVNAVSTGIASLPFSADVQAGSARARVRTAIEQNEPIRVGIIVALRNGDELR